MDSNILDSYRSIIGPEAMEKLVSVAASLKGKSIVHVNSTREGGGVAEILSRMMPLSLALGLAAQWQVIEGNESFSYQCICCQHVCVPCFKRVSFIFFFIWAVIGCFT